jgi:hypothetical protein
MAFALCNASGIQRFEVAASFFENLLHPSAWLNCVFAELLLGKSLLFGAELE